MEIFEKIQKISNFLSANKWGENLAETQISDTSMPLVNAYRMAKDYHNGDTLAECITAAATGSDCDINPEQAAAEVVTAAALQAANTAAKLGAASMFIGPSTLIGVGTGLFGTAQDHQETIRLLAENNVPGFDYKEIQINGENIKLWVDAADEENPTTYAESTNFDPKIQREIQQSVNGHLNQMTSKALSDVQDYKSQNGEDGYQKLLDEQADLKIAEYYIAHLSEENRAQEQRDFKTQQHMQEERLQQQQGSFGMNSNR